MKKIIALLASAAIIVSAAGCGQKKESEAPEPETATEAAMAGEMAIPDNWDGMTFKNDDGSITIVAPEEGWSSAQNTEDGFVITKGTEFISYNKSEVKNPESIPKDEAAIKKSMGSVYNITDVKILEDDEEYTYEFTAKDEDADCTMYVLTTIKGDTRIERRASTTNENGEERLEQFKEVIMNGIEVKE